MELHGTLVRLEGLRPEHVDELWPGADDPDIWRLHPEPVRSRAELAAWVERRVAGGADGRTEPFLIRDAATNGAAGVTTYYKISPEHANLSIGWTWLTAPYRGTGHNTETKLLLLRHAFQDRGMRRVRFDVDSRNTRSRAAVERLGAVQDGILRQDRRMPDGTWRDTVVYSILTQEWPAVEARLLERLDQVAAAEAETAETAKATTGTAAAEATTRAGTAAPTPATTGSGSGTSN